MDCLDVIIVGTGFAGVFGLHKMREAGFRVLAVEAGAQENWMNHVDEAASGTLLNEAASWYRGANVHGKPQKFMPYVGGVNTYQQKCRNVAEAGYEGFKIEPGR